MRCSCRKPRSARTRLENSSTSSEPVIPRSSAWSSWARLTASSWWWIKVSRKVSRSPRAISRNWVRVPPYSRNQRLVSPARETFSTARQRSAQGLNWGHEDQFRPPSLSGRCRLGEATFAGMGDKEEGAPIPVVGRRKLTGQDRPKSTSAGYVRTKMIRMCLESSGSWRKLHSHYRAAGVDPSGHPLRVAASATRDVIFSLQDRGKQDPSLGLGAVRSARAKNIGHELFLGS